MKSFKTLSTDPQLLQSDGKHLKSSFKLQIINEISFSYLFSKLGSSSSNQHFKSQNCLKTCQLTNALISVPTTTTQTPILTLGTTISPFGVVGNLHALAPSTYNLWHIWHTMQQINHISNKQKFSQANQQNLATSHQISKIQQIRIQPMQTSKTLPLWQQKQRSKRRKKTPPDH